LAPRPLAVALALLLAIAACRAPETAPAPRARLEDALATVTFVAYTPRDFDPNLGSEPVERASIRADLTRLRPLFDGLVTYSSARGLDAVPAIARELGFRAVVVGVWDPTSDDELARAFESARGARDVVIALALGNEGLFFERYDADALARAFARARHELPGVAVTTTEPFFVYLEPARAAALPAQDLVLPTVHPIDQPWFASAPPAAPVEFVANVVRDLEARTKLPVLVKETGVPSGPADEGFSEAAQAAFWVALGAALPPTRTHAVVRFEAFDGPWKTASVAADTGDVRPSEAHWGFFRADGSAKPVVAATAGAATP
jgi:exo-beta-1,3-glucanase (GH17 family)